VVIIQRVINNCVYASVVFSCGYEATADQ
jgi:hypothetical protein